ncbi:hypothetical protein PC129_g19386 [Phytophthora cactorum]|uniref:Tc1-like transposase DDE domain-containing protein n=1 Tax=Phytophthora cactorum TaxID=29920 RepID=A0A8T1DE97_9STRA|nr:hypothetical protein PC112_g20468 [Phytophthora cactorum]KAG2834223.1 hypothetical protein PC111_g5930 [Phytophthora cactorum]KAG2863351.1 hypothetical protein PC113_g5522 [Phytophthora cactorum]KAG2879594.1 hypothetical protein PC114_g22497 [Phytophthora cactorum]KAG2939076.1 hypothetical protein PC115_g3331 [Phytophthora cactorum]
MFEKWFTNLCATLKKDYGPCNIHMDGASYHKRLTNPTPNKSLLKAEIQNWLTERTIYATHVIAAKFDHLVNFTPPYHPELQPAEMVWGLMKIHIAATDKELDTKVEEEFSKVTEEHWIKYYRHMQKFESE